MYEDLKDRVVLITGGGRGFGEAAAKAFLEQGSKVAIVDIDESLLDGAVKRLGADEDRLISIAADVSKDEDVKNYVDRTVEKWGRIDVFFNNAGIGGPSAPIVEQKVEDFDRVIAVNLRGSWLGMHHVLPIMYKQKSGSVINSSSIGGLVAGPTPITPYVASKFGITGLTRLVAQESAQYQVRVNSIHPSPAATEMMRELERGVGADEDAFASAIPLGRYATAKDIANLVLFLGSDQSSFITGSEHRIDGGMLS